MKSKVLSMFTVFVASVVFSVGALACQAMGPTTHVGRILSFDLEKSTFTILDSETVSPVTFSADEKIMQQIAEAKGMAMVDFTDDGVTLTATSVQTQ